MIRIDKGDPPPALLRAKEKYNRINSAAYLDLKNRADYDNGTKTFKFPSSYNSKAVKKALWRAQRGKCCFTEAKFVNDEAHVEHFRPKGKVDQWPNGPSSYPGYYWLAYEWSNLFYCKSLTNSSIKRNFFPLRGRVQRNRNHLDNRIEANVLIDPSDEDPRLHIRFQNEEIKGITTRGRNTIEILELRNPQLDEARRTKFKLLESLKEAIDILLERGMSIQDPRIISKLEPLKYAITPEAEFSSMAKDLLEGWPHI